MAESQEPQLQANMLSATDRPQKPRHRASVACSACRDRRTRCVVPVGETQCTQCRDAGQECVIKHDDERRKPNSKAYVNSLRERIAHLESMLEEREQKLSEHTSPTIQPAQPLQSIENPPADIIPSENTNSFDFALSQLAPTDLPDISLTDIAIDGDSPANSAHSTSSSTRSTMVHRLLSTKGHLSFDQLSGRLRYYGPTTNCHVHSELAARNEEHNRQALEQQRRTQRVLSTLPQETQEYLMQMFWQYYNSVIHVIHQAAFEEGLHVGQGKFYSPFLHICILGVGFRHADKRRPDIMKISLPGKESTLHREAKYMLDYELERPGGITSIQALLLLGDLECGVGRDNLGWLISGMANRLCFDIGLHLDNSQSGLSQLEVEIGRMTLWACVIYDRYWALFLGRPTALKPEDLEVYRLAQQFERLGGLEPAGPNRNLEKLIYEALLDLMELAGKITEIMDKASKPNANLDQHVYITMAALNRELETWYARLPYQLQWAQENIEGAPFSYYLLHQQYHAAMILLHRQFAQYDDIVSSSDQGSEPDHTFAASSHFSTLSRMTCTRSAGRIAQIFWQHRQKYPTSKIFVTGLQHAGTAAIALVAAIASLKDRASYDTNMKYLECLAASIDDMCETYQPAERMSTVLNAVLAELKAAQPPRTYLSSIPARRDSSDDRDEESEYTRHKRHQGKRPGAQRTISQLSQPPMFATEHHRRHTTTGTSLPLLPTYESNKGSSEMTSNNSDGYVLVSTDPESAVSDLTDGWPRLDLPNPFPIDEMNIISSFGRPASPSQFGRSAWMGAETPTFSPIPTGTSASAFLSGNSNSLDTTGGSERNISNQSNSGNSNDIFASSSNLDFMALLNGTDTNTNTQTDNHATTGTATSSGNNNQAVTIPLPSLPTPTSIAGSNSGGGSAFGASPPQQSLTTKQRPGSISKNSKNGVATSTVTTTNSLGKKDTGFSHSQTMAGLDDIWREMMRTNNQTSDSRSSSKKR